MSRETAGLSFVATCWPVFKKLNVSPHLEKSWNRVFKHKLPSITPEKVICQSSWCKADLLGVKKKKKKISGAVPGPGAVV